MRLILYIVGFSVLSLNLVAQDIPAVNAYKEKADQAFQVSEYNKAITAYTFLTDSLKTESPEIYNNLALCYYHIDSLALASEAFQRTIDLKGNKELLSQAYTQQGNILLKQNKIELTASGYSQLKPEQIDLIKESQSKYKSALKANPGDSNARYNFEAVSKWLNNMPEEQKQEQQQHDKEKKEQQKKEQEKQEKQEQKQKDQQKQEKQEQKDQQKQDQEKDGEKDQDKKGDKDDQNKDQEGQKKQEKDEKNGEKQDQKEKKEGDQGKKDDKKGDQKDQKGQGEGEKKEGEEKDQPTPSPEKTAEEKKAAEQKAREAQIQQRLKENNLSKEKALQLLNSYNQQEKKYLQQMEKKTQNKSNNSDKPDW